MPYTCDGLSVGVLIFDDHDRLLMITRAHAPSGIAPVAGHVRDENPDFTHLDAAVAEVAEEVGLTVTKDDLAPDYTLWHKNRCGAEIPHPSGGHHWKVFTATRWEGTVTRSEDETTDARWYTPAEVQALGERTLAYAQGHITEQDWQTNPGLEPVWVDILAILPKPYRPGTSIFDTVVRFEDGRLLKHISALYGDDRDNPGGGHVVDAVGGDDFKFVDHTGRQFTLDLEELTVTNEACTGESVSASVTLPDPGSEAAHQLLSAVLAAMGMADDYEVTKKER